MLALDDGAMARVVIAAGAVPRRDRGRWLASLAAQVEGDRSKSGAISNARRQWAFRERRRNELLQLKVTVARDDIVAALAALGLLNQHAAVDRATIKRALTEQIGDWARAWGERA